MKETNGRYTYNIVTFLPFAKFYDDMFPNEPTVNKLYSKDQPSYHYDDRKKIFKSKL